MLNQPEKDGQRQRHDDHEIQQCRDGPKSEFNENQIRIFEIVNKIKKGKFLFFIQEESNV